jgi:hypothetical protein
MTECKKTLNSAASTLKKNPDRVARLAKMAGFRIVPPSHYATGATKKSLEDAVAKLKGKRGLNGVTGPGAGPFADKIEKVSHTPHMQKAAGEKTDAAISTVAGAGAGVAGYKIGKARARGKQDMRNDMRSLDVGKRAANKSGGNLMKGMYKQEQFRSKAGRLIDKAERKGGRVGALVAAGSAALGTHAALKGLHKKADDTSKGVAAGTVGGIVGAGMLAGKARDKQADKVAKRSLKQYKGAKNFMKGYGASEKFTRRSWKTVRHANKVGGRVGALAGAAAGTAAYLGAKKALEKKAADKKTVGYSAALGATGVAAGLAMGRDIQKHKNIVRSYGRNIRQLDAGKSLSQVYSRADTFDRRAAKTVKGAGRRGALIGGAAGIVAGLASRKIEKSMEKKAEVSKQTKDRALAASAVASGATLGGVLTHDKAKANVKTRHAIKENARAAKYANGSERAVGFSRRLARSARVDRNMVKPLRRAGIKGAIVGGLAGAALGAAHLKKEASDNRAVTAGTVVGGATAGAAIGRSVGRKIGKHKATEREISKKVIRSHKLRFAVNEKIKNRDFDRYIHNSNAVWYARGPGKWLEGELPAAHQLTRHNAAKAITKGTKKGGIKGALAGAAIGAGLGAASRMGHKKEAAVPAIVPKSQFIGKGDIPAGAKDVSPKAVLKRKAGKAGKIALGVAGGVALASAAKKHFEKKAEKEKKDSHVVGAAVGAGSVAYQARSNKDTMKGFKGLHKQYTHLLSKGHQPGPVDIQMAMKTLENPIARRAAKAGGKAALAGAVAGAAYDHFRGHKKSAAEKITHDGKTVRKGTVTSAAAKMGTAGGVLSAITNRKNPKMLQEAAKNFVGWGAMGGTYGVARKGLRTARGEKSMNPSDFKKLKKQAAEMIVRDGKKYRKGTANSAAATMAGANGGLQLAANINGINVARRAGIPMSRAAYLTKIPQAAAGGALMGYAYGAIRGHYRKKRGEQSLSHADFKDMKSGLAKKAAELLHHNGEKSMAPSEFDKLKARLK